MIDSITISTTDFDFSRFVFEFCKFWREIVPEADPIEGVYLMATWDAVPVPNYSGEDLHTAVFDHGKLAFFMLHEAAADEEVCCVDGTIIDSDELDIGVADGYGFVVEVRDDHVSLHPALYDGSSGPLPNVTVQGTASAMEAPMTRFAKRFVTE